MAHFIARLTSLRGNDTTRLGSKNSGASAGVAGWNTGVNVEIRHIDGKDVVFVWRTKGSNAHGFGTHLVATWKDDEVPELNPSIEYDDSTRTEERY